MTHMLVLRHSYLLFHMISSYAHRNVVITFSVLAFPHPSKCKSQQQLKTVSLPTLVSWLLYRLKQLISRCAFINNTVPYYTQPTNSCEQQN